MDRLTRVRICKTCQNHDFDPEKGVICSLTNDVAKFTDSCPDYTGDQSAIAQMAEITGYDKQRKKIEQFKARNQELKNQIDPVKAVKGGASWFYWIAALSLINSIAIFAGGDINFIVGLGITQLIDGILLELTGTGNIYGLIASALISGMFFLFGYFANKFSGSAFMAGIILYLLDSLIFLLVGDWLGLGFHAFALFMIISGYRQLKQLKSSENQVKEEGFSKEVSA